MTEKYKFRGHYRTWEFSGGLTMSRFPQPKTPGRTLVRSAMRGFQIDQTGGNRIPKVGKERRAIALGHTVITEEPAVKLRGRLSRDVKARNSHVRRKNAAAQWRPLPSRRVAAAALREQARVVHEFKAAAAARGGVL